MADELLNEFINESREHLQTIESDLLAIEEDGADINEELVNKVFRAAHSIKGGSSFFGLTKVKELAHKAETVLDMMRTRKITPNPEITNLLLASFDKLRDMINNPDGSDQVDTSELLIGLTGLASANLAGDQKGMLARNVALENKEKTLSATLTQIDFERAKRNGQCIYIVEYDLIHDMDKAGLSVLNVFRELEQSGEILDGSVDCESLGTLDDAIATKLPLKLIYATTIAPEIIHELMAIPADRIKLLYDPQKAGPAPVYTLAPQPQPEHALGSLPSSEVPQPVSAPPRPLAPIPEPMPEPAPAPVSAPVVPARAAAQGSGPTPIEATPVAGNDETIRVNVMLLEMLMNLAGELVLGRNQLRAAVSQNDVQSLSVADQRINQITSELQDAIMRTRLQPIGNVFNRFPRVVRDMSNSLGKDIQLDIRGRDVALDRSLIEGLSDPLTHMVRNAVDHGIERPADRVKAGKSSAGTICIEAKHEAGQVVVEISDDGKGIDSKKVVDAAIAKGLISPQKAQTMSEHDKISLIFLPGLSTAQAVTDLSGRGVGMDVVKTNLDRLGGKVEIKTALGKGSLFRIKLPLTLAIIPSLIVSIAKERFAIPQINVEELLRIQPGEYKTRIEVVGGAEVLLLRDRILPLVRFDRYLHGEKTTGDAHGLEIAVVTTGATQYALVVGAFHDTEEIVVKPLGRHLKGLREYAGATILGDGAVALILDVAGLAGKVDLAMPAKNENRAGEEADLARLEDSHSLLLFRNAPEEICAISLGSVLRIERIAPEQVEMVGSRRTFQYRGASLPLVTMADAAPVNSIGHDSRELVVIVSNVHGREVGLLGAMPVDVVESNAAIDPRTHRQKGISGSAIIRNRTTLIVDIAELVDTVFPEWAAEAPASTRLLGDPKKGDRIVLLAEDSDFFRAQVKKYLQEDGYIVMDAPDGEAAWELLNEHAGEVRAVVTDIEMPRLTGLDLTRRIRADTRLNKLPVIALTSLASEEDAEKGKAAGFTDYQVKLDRDKLLTSLHAIAGTI